jgi:K+-sensing histidine kinase KdpD
LTTERTAARREARPFLSPAAPARAYAVAVALPLLGELLRAVLIQVGGRDPGLSIEYVAVIVTALYGGLWPGVAATVIAGLLETITRSGPLTIPGSAPIPDPARIVFFVVAGVVSSIACALVRDARWRAEQARREEAAARSRAERSAGSAAAFADLAITLGSAMTSADVARTILSHGMQIGGARAGAVLLTTPGARAFSPIAATGYAAGLTSQLHAILIDGSGIEDRLRTLLDDGDDTTSVYPLGAGSRQLGFLVWTFAGRHVPTADEGAQLGGLVSMAVQALDRSTTYESEIESRRRAEASGRHLDLLADAGRILGSSLDYEETLRSLARLVVTALGDFCAIDLVQAGGAQRLVAAASDRLPSVAALEHQPIDLQSTDGVGASLREGMAVVLGPGDDVAGCLRVDAGRAAEVAAFGLRSAMIVPIRLREETIGAVIVATADAQHVYEPTDVAVAEVLAQRSAKAIDNGRLHREIQRLAEFEQERAAEMESVVGAIGEGIVVCDPQGTVRVINAAASQMLGGPVASLDGLRAQVQPRAASLPEPGVPFGPVEFQPTGRRSAWLELTAYPVTRAADVVRGSGGSVYVIRDVTAFRQGQRLREAFLGLLSHELRTPVTTIYAAANVLGKPGSTLPEPTRQEILGDMVGEANRLYRLVEDLMVLARFDEGLELARDPNLLQHLVPAVLESERARWPHVRFELHQERSLPTVNGDETSIQQVLRNMLSNAAKYSPVGTTVEVRVESDADGAVVRVLDEGPGIRADEADDLFDPFYRSPATAKMASGAGIGLYVCRRLLDAMGGRIWARPRAHAGSEFAFWLPRYVPPTDEYGDSEQPAAHERAEAADGAAVDSPLTRTATHR